MAATSKKGSRVRMDKPQFGDALDNALFKSDKQIESVNSDEIVQTNGTEDIEQKDESIAGEVNGIVNEEIADTMETVNISSKSIKEPLKSVIKTPKKQEIFDDDEDEDDAIFASLIKGGRGVQRSIYLESDVYHYIQSKSEKYNVKFSNVVNLLLKEAIYKKK